MKKILIIDDFEPFRSTACRVVERLGFEVVSAPDGRRGLDLFMRQRPDIVITDLQMPEVDGTGVLLAIKEKSPETAVVVLTGFSTEPVDRELLRLGAFACLKKPLNLQRLIEVIGEIQSKQRGPTAEAPPTVFLKVNSFACREVLERTLRANGWETRSPPTPDQWRGPLERGEVDLVVWEVHAEDVATLRRMMEVRLSRMGFEVLLLVTESGPAETVAQEILQEFPVECLSAPLDDAVVAASFHKALHRLLVARNTLYKKERMDLESVRICVGSQGDLWVDGGGVGPLWESLERLGARLPWPWLLLGPSWEVVYASPALVAWTGRRPTRLDRELWDILEGRGLVLPPLEEIYPALTRCARGETYPAISFPEAVGMMSIKISHNFEGSDRFVALFFPAAPPLYLSSKPSKE